MIDKLKKLQQQKTDVLWMIRFKEATPMMKGIYIMTACKCCIARIFMHYSEYTIEQLQAKLMDIHGAINEIMDSVSLDELKEIL